MKTNLFPQIPSYLELQILSFVDYCNVCKIHEKHPIKLCILCDKHICYKYDDNIWTLNNTNKEICQDCRSRVIKKGKKCTFVSIRKFFHKI